MASRRAFLVLKCYAYTVEGPKAFLLQIEFVDYEIGDSPFAFGSIE
jgi:hypothetical protein